jgi:L-methionine (R)-S-oxide reductase
MIENKVSKVERYNLLIQQIEGLLNDSDPIVTNLSNITAAIKQTFSIISWVGFYLRKDTQLYLGPFQGKVACTKIVIGKGVCGTSAETKKTQIVPNVHEFPGHIACDVETNSEIVVPLINDNKVYAVFDLDSTEFAAFDEIDKDWLEQICRLVTDKLDLSKSILV